MQRIDHYKNLKMAMVILAEDLPSQKSVTGHSITTKLRSAEDLQRNLPFYVEDRIITKLRLASTMDAEE